MAGGCCVLCLKFPKITQGIWAPKRVGWGRALVLEHSWPFPACPSSPNPVTQLLQGQQMDPAQQKHPTTSLRSQNSQEDTSGAGGAGRRSCGGLVQ